MALSMKLPARSRTLLDRAAKTHHDIAFSPGAVEALMRDCLGGGEPQAELALENSNNLLDPLLARILEMADQFDEELEFAPYADEALADLLANSSSPAVAYVLPHLRKCNREDLIALVPHLPVCPARALDVIRMISRGRADFDDLVRAAVSDPVLAGSVLKAANSAAFPRFVPVRGVQEAVMYVGTEQAGQVILAAALRPLLSVRGGDTLWSHSLESAVVAEMLASRTRYLDPHEAYVLGLLHDIGKLLLNIAPPGAQTCRDRLRAAGVPDQLAEIITYGADHALAGTAVMRAWGLPDDYLTAVEWHHQPDRSDSLFAALLYIVEFCTGSEEDIPSDVRMRCALDRVGLSYSDVNVMAKESTNLVLSTL
jgi:putative nucleotidyltransferase with HDIG domain